MGLSKSIRHNLIDMVRGVPGDSFQAGSDATSLRREAQRQGVLSLVSPEAPPDFQAAAVHEAVKTTRLLDATARVQEELRRRGIRSVALKGTALHGSAYSRVDERPMLDADLWVLDDFAQAEVLLADLGFEPIERADHAVAYQEHGSGAIVELHWSVTSAPGFFPVDAESVWEGRRHLCTGIVAPSGVDTFVLLALHSAFQHGLVLRLVQHGDFHALMGREGLLAAPIASRAREWGALTALSAAVEVASHVRGELEGLRAIRRKCGPLPRRLAHHVQRAHATPTEFLEPATPRLALVRLAVAEGRRIDLLRRTLWPRDGEGSRLAHATSGLARGASLLRRHIVPRHRAMS